MKSLNYMGSADALEVQLGIARRLLVLIQIGEGARTEEEQREFEYLNTVLTACETIIDHLNGEYAAFKDAQKPDHFDREVFNTP